MARRLVAETPYTPLDDSLVASILQPSANADAQAGFLSEQKGKAKKPKPPLGKYSRSARQGTMPKVSKAPSSRTLDNEDSRQDRTDRDAFTERMSATLRVKASSREKREFEAFVARLGASLDTTLKPSNVLRTVLSVVQHAESELIEAARRVAPMRRPPNDDAIAYAEFEYRLVRLIDAAIRNATPVR